MNIGVIHGNDVYALLVDDIGDVMDLGAESFEESPRTIPQTWIDISRGIYKLEERRLMVELDIGRVLEFIHEDKPVAA